MKQWILICTILISTAAGCGLAPNLSEDAQKMVMPETFSASGSEKVPAQWWIVFDDPELNRLVSLALAESYSMRTAWDRLDQAAASARAAGAKLFPSLSADAGVSRSLSLTDFGGANTRSYASDLSLGMTASYEVDLWGENRNTRRASSYDALASQQSVYTSAVTLTSQIASTWYSIIGQNIQIRLLKRQILTNETYLGSLEQRFKQGLVTATDLLQVKGQIEAGRGDMELAVSTYETLKNQLAVLCGKAPGTLEIQVPDDFPKLPGMPNAGLPVNLIKRRPDVEAAFLRIQAADARAASAVAARFPALSFTARGETSDGEVSGLFKNWFGNFIANLSGPLFQGGRLAAEAERSQAAAREALNSYKAAVLAALSDVEDSLIREKRQSAYLESLKKQFDLSSAALERTKDGFANGMFDYLRVITAIQSYDRLERQVAAAEQSLFLYRIALYRALGGPWKLTHYQLDRTGK